MAGGTHVASLSDLYKHWKCTFAKCVNYTYCCFVDKADGKHYKLDSSDIVQWEKSIRRGNATVNSLSDNLCVELMRREKRKSNNNTPNSGPSGLATTNVNINLSDLQQMLGLPRHSGNATPRRGSSTLMTPTRQYPAFLSSSPVQSETGETRGEFDRYFEYLRKKFQYDESAVDAINDTQTVLHGEQFDLKGIKAMTTSELAAKANIKEGIAGRIQRYIKEFQALDI